MFAAFLGSILNNMDCDPNKWHGWAIIAIFVVTNLLWMIRERKRSIEKGGEG
jgi:hypothetical protein